MRVTSPDFQMTRQIIILLALLVFACGCSQAGRFNPTFRQGSPEWHAERLAAGDLRNSIESLENQEQMSEDDRNVDWYLAAQNEPYHLRRLIDAKGSAADVLLNLLKNLKPLPWESGYSTFRMDPLEFGSGVSVTPDRRYNVTVADLADYALRKIYRTDVGFRSYRTQEERGHAILHWKEIIRQRRMEDDRDVGRVRPIVLRP